MRVLSLPAALLVVAAFSACGLLICPPPAAAEPEPSLDRKLNAYIQCINRLSERSFDSRSRYFSWVGKKGPTGRERIIYGTYTIYDTAGCRKGVEAANALEPRDGELEAAATSYSEAVTALEPLLKEADDYYTQENYKDDRMAKGKALHPRLVAAWGAFEQADRKLRKGIETLQDKRSVEHLAAIEQAEGRKARYHVEALMISAKRLLRAEDGGHGDVARMTAALADYEGIVKATEDFAGANKDSRIGSMFVSSAKGFLVTAKQLMRRIRDKVGYSRGEKMILNSGGGAWMVDGSPARLTRDYNQLVEAYNRGWNI
jgi:hypothetical protein